MSNSDDREPKVGDLVMLVSRLVQQVKKHDPENDVAKKAMDYLKRKDLMPSILREFVPEGCSMCIDCKEIKPNEEMMERQPYCKDCY